MKKNKKVNLKKKKYSAQSHLLQNSSKTFDLLLKKRRQNLPCSLVISFVFLFSPFGISDRRVNKLSMERENLLNGNNSVDLVKIGVCYMLQSVMAETALIALTSRLLFLVKVHFSLSKQIHLCKLQILVPHVTHPSMVFLFCYYY